MPRSGRLCLLYRTDISATDIVADIQLAAVPNRYQHRLRYHRAGDRSMSLTLRLCGMVEVRSETGEFLGLRRHGLALLAYLALAPGHAAPRSALAEKLWPMRATAQARGSLRQCLSDIRGCHAQLDALIATTSTSIQLRIDLLTTDLTTAVTASGPSQLIAALAEMGTEPLVGIAIPGAFDRWIAEMRVSVEMRLRGAVHRQLTELARDALWGDVERVAQAWLARVPGDEVAAGALRRSQDGDHSPTAAAPVQALRPARSPVGEALAPTLVSPPMLIVAAFGSRGDKRDAALAASIRDELLLGLARFRELRLIDDYRDADAILTETAGEGFLLSAVLATYASHTLTVRLVSCSDRQVLWSERFDLGSVALSSELDHVIGQVGSTMLLESPPDLLRVQQAAGRIYARFVAAKAASQWPPNFAEAKAAGALLRLIQTDAPDFAPAYLAQARLINTDYAYTRVGRSVPTDASEALALAQAALALDQRQSNCWTQVGWCLLRRREWLPARAHFEQALRLNPYHAARVNEVASGFLYLGEQETANGLLERSRALMLMPDHIHWSDRGFFEIVAGDPIAACDAFASCPQPMLTTSIYTVIAHTLAGRDATEVLGSARERLRHAWFDGRDPSVDDLISWFDRHHPFRRPADRALFHAGLADAFA